MDPHDGLDVEAQPLEVFVKRTSASVWGWCSGEVEVGLHDDLLMWDIRDEHTCRMGKALDVVEFHRPRVIGEDVLFAQGLEDVAFRPLFRWME